MSKPEAEIVRTLGTVEQILEEMGLGAVANEAALISTDASEGDAVLRSNDAFGRFIRRFSIRMGCMPYPIELVQGLTVRQFCELYVRESYPGPPDSPLHADSYTLDTSGREERSSFAPHSFPIGFVLGVGRSGTTLFRAMLNMNESLWAPGELHLAQFDTMADRAAGAGPFLRHALVPETSARFRVEPTEFSGRFAAWEREALPIPEVYRLLHEADPETLIVDKTPNYSGSPQDLDWIARHFPNARFVHIIRNPHDVIRSFVRMQLYKGALDSFAPGINPHHVAEIAWFRHNSNIAAFFETLPTERALVVRFEDLVASPGTTLSGVCDLLGVAYDPRIADPYSGDSGRIAQGAGDPRVNLLTEVEQREPAPAFCPLGERAEQLAAAFGY